MSSTTKRPTRKTRCPGCNSEWNTRANGYSVTCVQCGQTHYVPRAVDPADHLATRPHREVTCRACGNWFTTRARQQSATKCPECRASVWVPLAAPVAPEVPRQRARDRDPEPVWWDDDNQDDAPPAGAGTVGAFSRLLSGFLARPTPAPAPVAPVRPARPAPAPAVARPVAMPRQNSPRLVYPGFARPGDRAPVVRPDQRERLYGMPVWPVATRRPGRCALVSAHRDDEQCRGSADAIAEVTGREFVVCEGHGYAVQRADALGQVPPLA
jgi:predicted Zn-ribbon and HTH transcriptional regulator